MITIHHLALSIYKKELSELVNQVVIDVPCIETYVLSAGRWQYVSQILVMSGMQRGERLKVSDINHISKEGILILQHLAKVSRGTVIAIAKFEDGEIPIVVNKGQIIETTLIEIENGLRKASKPRKK